MLKKRAFKKPEKPESLEVLVAQYDAAARDAAVSWRSALFDHTPATLSVLDEMLEELHGQYTQKSFKKRLGLGTSDVDVAQWANLWGIYAGETIRLELGGKWITGHEEAPTLLAVELPDGTVLFPTARVFRRITDGAAESVAEYYRKVTDMVGGTQEEPSSQ
ncbi:MAG: hypothetical protein ABIR47_00130 [Candidatus Kapaibacterium sp.]